MYYLFNTFSCIIVLLEECWVKQNLSLLLSFGCCAISQGIFLKSATAQVIPDGSSNTTVNAVGNNFTIQQGDRAGNNLFHSFGDFSVPNGGSAFFDNANDIANIFSRVTGGNISNIDGLIRANGTANLFLINPAGILFGAGARLDIGGSFLGSTADSILFEDGEFSATDFDDPPLLTINAPIGLNFRDNPEDIVNRSVAGGLVENLEFARPKFTIDQIPVGLEVEPGKNLALIGGDVKLENGNIYAPGGKVELGGLEEAGVVSISNDGSFIFPNDKARSNVSLTNIDQQEYGSIVNVAGEDGGSIKVHGQNLELSGRSFFFGGIKEASSNPNSQAGDIEIDVTEDIVLNIGRISNIVSSDTEGNSGNINIKTKNLSIITSRESSSNQDASNISTNILGTGDAGDITINASEQISLEAGNKRFGSIQSTIEPSGTGNAGDINIATSSLLLKGRNSVRSNTIGQGDAGNATINASEQISLQGEFISQSFPFSTGIASQERPGAEGNSGQIIINTPFLLLSDYSLITASAQSGQAGDIRITVEDLFLRNTSRINVGGTGPDPTNSNGGNLFIDARFIVAFPEQGTDLVNFPNNVISAATNRGNGGNINITATGIFGIEEREPEPGVNYISASSDLGIDGNISINIPDVNTIQADTDLPENPIESEQTVAQACSANREIVAKNGLTIQGKGGIRPEPTKPLDLGLLLVDGKIVTPNSQAQHQNINPIKTSIGDITPARGIIKTEDGQVILTAYRTDKLGTRTPHISANCS